MIFIELSSTIKMTSVGGKVPLDCELDLALLKLAVAVEFLED
jgi:hypothetical protein